MIGWLLNKIRGCDFSSNSNQVHDGWDAASGGAHRSSAQQVFCHHVRRSSRKISEF